MDAPTSASAAATASWRVRYQIPKFDWDAFNAKIVKCEFCKERLAEGKEPACTFVCPPRPSSSDAVTCCCARRIGASATSRVSTSKTACTARKKLAELRCFILSAVNFDLLGLPHSGRERASQQLAALAGARTEILHPSDWDLCRHGGVSAAELPRARNGNRRRTQEDGVDPAIMSSQTQSDLTVVRWQRGVPVFGVPVVTKNFLFLAGTRCRGFHSDDLSASLGLGAASGLSDGFPWGIWKTFNVMTLTALGSGSFPIGIAAWIFHKRKLHAVMRT